MNTHRTSALVLWAPAILWAAAIFLLASRAVPDIGPRFPHKDKVVHLCLYGVLGWLVTRPLRRAHGLPLQKAVALAIILAALYGASDEWHQSFVPHRTADIDDWLADLIGAALGQIAHWYDAYTSSKTNR